MNTGLKLEVIRNALASMGDKGYFDICVIDACLKMTGGIPPADEYAALRALHCVRYDKMSPRLRLELPRLVESVMIDQETIDTQIQGFEFLCSQARIIAMLPLEDWLAALNKAETLGPILDPTLDRDYHYSQKAQILKTIIEAAIPLKRAVLAAQPKITPTPDPSPATDSAPSTQASCKAVSPAPETAHNTRSPGSSHPSADIA